jgi:hypothetical protein
MPYRIAGIDVHKRMLAVAVSDVGIDGEYAFERRQFGSKLRPAAIADEKGPAWRNCVPSSVRAIPMERQSRPRWPLLGRGFDLGGRDPIYRNDKKSGEPVLDDPGVDDKRLLVFESEFALVLRVMARETNTLTAVLRQAWDREKLDTMVTGRTHSTAVATGAHISIVGHITAEELRRYITETELA